MPTEEVAKPAASSKSEAEALAEQIRAEFALLEQWQEELREGHAAAETKVRKARA